MLSIILTVFPAVSLCLGHTAEVVKGMFTPLSAWKGKSLLRASALPPPVPLLELSCLEPCWGVSCEHLHIRLTLGGTPAHAAPEPARGIKAWPFGPHVDAARRSLLWSPLRDETSLWTAKTVLGETEATSRGWRRPALHFR